MPMYTYTCPDCGGTKTLIRKVAERDFPTQCDKGCEEAVLGLGGLVQAMDTLMDRDIEGPAFHLKGGSWARDGYK